MGACCCKEEEIDFDAEVELSHFHLLRSVGKGAFGKVRVVQHKHTKVLYALKYINKAKCIKMRAVENIIQERRLLEEIDYPLVCNLRYAFQDDENLFMVLDLMLGGDLRFHLERYGQMSEDVVRFYVAEVSLGLAYLHSKRIVHRDLKPDNVLLDDKGHAHLTDFNIAVHCHEKKPLMSVAGSMAYMAPEVLTKKGYYESVDWWSLGVVMYELLFSKRPFRGKTNSALTQAILHEPLVFPDNVRETVSDDCMDVIRRFCERDVSKRLGCGPRGLEDIKCHPWFRDVEWDKLDTKEARAPFVPDSKKANFDATHELEELLLEDNPLKAKKRNANQDINELSKEMRMMEEKFLIYDFTKMRRRSYFTNNLGMEMASSQRRGSRNLRPQLTPLPLPETETTEPTAAGIEEIRDDVEAKLNGEWLNERPVSPANREQRRRSAFLGSFGGSGRASPIVAAPHDSDYFLAKPHSHTSSRTPSPNTISPQEQIRSPSSMPILTQAAMTSLTPPPRVQSPTPKTHSISSASSRPTSPLESDPSTPNQPSMRYANPSPRLLTRSNGSLRRLSAVASPAGAAEAAPLSSAPLLPPQGPPPNGPLPPPPMTVKTTETTTTTTTTMTTTTTTTTLPISSACASATDGSFGRSNSFKLYTLSPSTAKRSALTSDEPSSLMPGADFADQPPTTNTFFTASTGTALTLHSGASEVSLATTVSMSSNEFHQSFSPYVGDVPSAVSSALGRVPSNGSHSHRRLSRSSLTSNGHYRSASEVSSVEHGALSAVGVPAGV